MNLVELNKLKEEGKIVLLPIQRNRKGKLQLFFESNLNNFFSLKEVFEKFGSKSKSIQVCLRGLEKQKIINVYLIKGEFYYGIEKECGQKQ